MQVASLVTSELQLGQQINRSVETGERANFALLLALLSEDVAEQDQFHFEQGDNAIEADSLLSSIDIPRAQHLIGNEQDEAQSLALGKLAQEQGTLAVRLSHCINPEALSFDLDKKYGIDTQVFDNLNMYSATKLSGETVARPTPKIDLVSVVATQQHYSAALIA